MTSPAERSQELDRDPHRLEAEIAYLPVRAAEWDDAQDSVRYDAEISWYGAMMGLHNRLDPAYCAGHMTSEQVEQYTQLLLCLREVLPIIRHLGFEQPRIAWQPRCASLGVGN
jgi:hypothetical protein